MKKTLVALTFASIFMAGAAQAVDHSATVDISGTVVGDHTECTVYAASSMVLNSKIDQLALQDQKATNSTMLTLNIGASDTGATGNCIGKVALQLQGIADDASGTVLANSDTGETAAKGVGIGLYDSNLNPLKINDNQIVPETNIENINVAMVKLNGQTAVEGTVHGSLTIDIVRL